MTSEIPLRPAWVEINLRALENNTRRLIEIIGNETELMAMVKGNAYGHGAIETARAVLRAGAHWLGGYWIGEALELRRAQITAPILVVGPTPPRWARAGVENNLSLTIFSLASARAISDAARDLNANARVHLKIDTGMTRLGVFPDAALEFARAAQSLSNLEIEGVYTHFAVADDPNATGKKSWGITYTRDQLAQFNRVIENLDRAGIRARYYHAANSPAALNLPASRLNLVRSGILIYGLDPSPHVPAPRDFIPALAFKTEIAQIKSVPRGTRVSYGATFVTARTSRIAVLMIGYADGFRRMPKNYGAVLVRGQRAPIVGRVCMDQTMIDVTDIPDAREGDEVVLIGAQGKEKISAEDVAEILGTNNYETVTTISARVPRVYV
ncbi:MAG: alanine racemase [Chloroflexi bacterium]|nr:alanine racemase [Chloroflexota bacterium]